MNGLSSHEVKYRIANGMVNNEEIKNSRSLKTIILSNMITLFNLIHLILFILVLTTGSIVNGFFVGSIIVNMIISIYQEIKAKMIIDKLTITTANKVTVLRDGSQKDILPSEIVLDDILCLKQGDSLVVDAVVVSSNNLLVDESIITGESDSITKIDGDKLISGSIIICGKALARVTSINRDTYANNLIKEASTVTDDSSYLKKSINSILKVVTILIVPVGLLLFITQFFYSNQTYSESILSSVAGIVGMIPDGLVLLTSISLTVGVIKMASKKVIIQKLNGIELLSCVDILCLDKTGTITDGELSVVDFINLTDNEFVKKDILIKDMISNMISDQVNATDIALGKYFSIKKDLKILDYVPFSSEKKYSLYKFEFGSYALGALEYLTNKQISDFKVLDKYVALGYRIITLVKWCDNKDKNKVIGFIILKDNVRKNAKETLDYFKKQDVDIKIISGDNVLTISNILKQLEIDGYDKYISGNELPSDYNELVKVVNSYKIFGRVTPYQKQLIIKALKENATVGMIGDGVNDILALKEADCGIALASGISAARSVSEVVLTDSDFSVLPNIVNEGRRVVNNIERVASMYLIKTVYSFLISLVCIFLSHEYPYYPVQLTLIGIVCVGIPSFFLAIEPNYNKVTKGFLVKVFRNALPSGICVCLNILFLIMFTDIFHLDFEPFRLVVVFVTGYLNLRLLYNISLPPSFPRKCLLVCCTVVFFGALIFLGEYLFIKKWNFLSIVFIILFVFADSYITWFLEFLYDKIVLMIKRRINSRRRSERGL